MVHAIKKSVEFSEQIGCAVIVLDVLVDGMMKHLHDA